jgi:hypothetical protein
VAGVRAFAEHDKHVWRRGAVLNRAEDERRKVFGRA